ncbi:MAG: lipoprotein [Cardiobacteriaceae bacterium]|nr:lipoprotein [Cardiobacteriaceae bacterium]
MKKIILIALSVVILTACAPKIENAANSTFTDKNNFNAQGKIALDCPKCDKYRCHNEPFSAAMNWQHQNQIDRLKFFDPMGAEVMQLEYQANGKITLRDKKQTRELTVEELAEEVGLTIPVKNTAHWLFENRGGQAKFNAENWSVETKNWQENGFYQRINLQQAQCKVKIFVEKVQGI